MSRFRRHQLMSISSIGPVQTEAQGRQWLRTRALGGASFNFSVRERDFKSPSGVRPRVIGLFGSYHWPECGYLLHPDFAGKGYATEGMKGFIPAYFERVPSACEGGMGHDFIEGAVDAENVASQKVLEKCGFTQCEMLCQDFESAIGLRDTIIYRLPRPGKTLEELLRQAEEEPPEPPMQ